jgi:putative flippase GtrA
MTGKSENLAPLITAEVPGSFNAVHLRFQRHRFFGQLSRYAIISVVALIVDFSIYLGLTSTGAAASLAAAIGYSAGLVLHYILSICFVFEAARTGKPHGRLFMEFVFSGIAGLITTVAIVTVAVQAFGLSAGMAKVCAVGISFALTFALRRYLVFAWSRAD